MSDNQLYILKIFGYFCGWLGIALVIFFPLKNLFKGRKLIWVILQMWLYGFLWSIILSLAFPVIAAWIFQDGCASTCFPDGSDFFPDGSKWVVPIAVVGWIPSLVICVTAWLVRKTCPK